VIGQFVDTTELHRSHTALTQLFETIPAALYRTTPDGQILHANPALLDLIGSPDLTTAQTPGLASFYVDHTERDRFKALMEEHEVVMGFEYELYHASGETIWVQDSARLFRDENTQEVFYEGALVDITSKKRALLELQASEERYRNVFNRSPVALFEEDFSKVYAWIEQLKTVGVTDIRAYLRDHPDVISEAIARIEILDANPAAARLLEADSTDQLIGPIDASMASSAEESFVEQVVAVAEGRDRLFLEATGQTFTGRSIDIVVMWVLSPGEDQVNSHRVLVAVVDVTERREAERQLRELVRTKDEIIASVSHEIRTPLTAIVGFAQEMRDNWDDMPSTECRDYVDVIAAQSVEVSDIVEDLLVAARIDVDRLTVAPSSIDLLDQVHNVVDHFNAMDRNGITIKGDSAMAWADQARTRQILRNLITNAQTHGGPNIEIHTSSDNGIATVAVRDDGGGIAPADIERAFQRYERLHDTTTQPASIGLGLHLSRELAQLMGGDITYTYVDGWTEFTLTLPTDPPAETPDHSNNRHTK
jgi:PAS domain S-box-containing protein